MYSLVAAVYLGSLIYPARSLPDNLLELCNWDYVYKLHRETVCYAILYSGQIQSIDSEDDSGIWHGNCLVKY